MQVHSLYNLEDLNNVNPQPDLHKIITKFIGGDPKPDKYPTRNCYPIQSDKTLNTIADRLRRLKITTHLGSALNRVCYVYDEQMTQHRNEYEEHPERPERVIKIEERFNEYKLIDRMTKLTTREATTEELCLLHSWQHVNFMRKTSTKSKELRQIGEKFNSVYLHPSTYKCATLAVGSTLEVSYISGKYELDIFPEILFILQ